MTMSFANDIEEALRDAIREANYNFRVTYKEMARNSGFKESTLKGFVNNETTRLPDERETLYCFIRLSRYLSSEYNCESISRIPLPSDKHPSKNGSAKVNGCLKDESLDISKLNGEMIKASENNNVSRLKEIAKQLGPVLSRVNAEIAMKEQG